MKVISTSLAIVFLLLAAQLFFSMTGYHSMNFWHLRIPPDAITPLEGKAYLFMLGNTERMILKADSSSGSLSNLVLNENDEVFRNSHEPHQRIIELGGGRYSHWMNEQGEQGIIFSALDNTDPRQNGRIYSASAPLRPLVTGGVLAVTGLILLLLERQRLAPWWRTIAGMAKNDDQLLMTCVYLVVTILLLWLTVLRLGDWNVNLAAYFADGDNIVTYARYFGNPSRYAFDPLADYANQQMFATAMNWIPVLVSYYTGIPAEVLAYAVAVLQVLLLGLAMAWFTKVITGNAAAALLAGLLLTYTSAWNQNLAFYGISLSAPYPGIFVIPFILVAVGAAYLERNKLMLLALASAALIHPSFTIYSVVILAFYILLETPPKPIAGLVKRLAFLVPPLFLVVGVAATLLYSAGAQVTPAEIYRSANEHFFPFLDPSGFYDIAASYSGWVCLYVISAYSMWDKLDPSMRRLLIAIPAGIGFLSAAAIAGIAFKVLPIIQLIPLRATALLPIIALPLISILMLRLVSSSITGSVAVLQLVQLLILANYGFFWGPVLVIAIIIVLGNSSQHSRRIAEIVGALILFGWNVMAYIEPAGYLQWISPGFRPGAAWQDTAGIFATLKYAIALTTILVTVRTLLRKAPFLSIQERSREQIAILSALLFLVAVSTRSELLIAQENNYFTYSQIARDLADAQQWAATQSPDDAIFVVEKNIPFRTMSQRATVRMLPSFGFIYSRSRTALDHDLKLLDFYGVKDDWEKGSQMISLLPGISSQIFSIDEVHLKKFLSMSHGHYYVRRKSWIVPGTTRPQRLSLPVAYENSSFVIHRVE